MQSNNNFDYQINYQYQDPHDYSQYYLSQTKNRQQIAKHFQSSLNQPNLQNVQSKLRATRQKNFQMGKQYFRNKYGSADMFQQQYGRMYREPNIGIIDENLSKGFKERLDQEADRIKRVQLDKIRRKALGLPQKFESELDDHIESLQQFKSKNKKKSNKNNTNPWLQQKQKGGKIINANPSKKKQSSVSSSYNNINKNNNGKNIISSSLISSKNPLQSLKSQISQQQSSQQKQKDKIHQEQYEQYQDDARQNAFLREQKKKNQFMNGFKNYLQKKKHQNLNQNQNQNQHLNSDDQDIQKSKKVDKIKGEFNKTSSSLYANRKSPTNKNKKSPIKKQKESGTTTTVSHQQQLVKKIYKDILGIPNPNFKTTVQKLSLLQYLISNKRIVKVLGLSQSQLTQKLMKQYQTKSLDEISYKQFVFFILKLLGKQKQTKKLQSNWRDTTVPKGCMLSQQIIMIFQSVFKKLDKYSDLIVPRIQLISKLATDPSIKKMLNSPAVYENSLQRSISLRRIFERIQLQCLLGNEQQQKAKEYISWQELMNYFESFSSSQQQQKNVPNNSKSNTNIQKKYDLILLLDSLKNQKKMGLSQIPQSIIQIFASAFDKLQQKSLNKSQQYFSTLQIIQLIRNHSEYAAEKYTMVRPSKSEQTQLSMQSLQQVLKRIQETGYKYMNIKQFLEYFSERGKPIDLLDIQQSMLMQKSFGAVNLRASNNNFNLTRNSKEVQEFIQGENEQIDGYDSDPQLYSSQIQSGKNSKNIKNHIKNESGFKRSTGRSKQLTKEQLKNIQNQNNYTYKITVPEPFKFEQRQRQRQQKRRLKQQTKQKLNRSASISHIHARQIPKKVLQIGLYQKMIEQNRKKIQERKRSSMIMTLANQKPFNFDIRQRQKERQDNILNKAHKKNKYQRQQFIFKAKPIPWHCSVNLLQKNKIDQQKRNQKIIKLAQQKLAKSKMPPRMQKDYQEQQAKKFQQQQRQKNFKKIQQEKQFKAKQPPNFDKLHKQFEEQLQKKRKDNKTTQIKQFNFSQLKPKKKTYQQNKLIEGIIQKNFSSSKQKEYQNQYQNQNIPPANSTAKFDQLCQKRRQQIQQKRKKQQQKHQQQLKRQQIDQQLKKKVQQKANAKKYKQKQQQQKRREQMKSQQKAYQQRKKQIIQKGRNQPMLMDRPLKRDQKIQKMKRLYMISQTLKSNGIKGKQHDGYFKKQELLLLQDYAVLKDKI